MSDVPAEQPRRPRPVAAGDEGVEPAVTPIAPPAGRHAASELGISPAPPPARRTRRWLLAGAGAGAALVGGGAGVGAQFLRRRATPRPVRPPAQLVAAVEAEQRLIADLDATTGGAPEIRAVLIAAGANHAVHLAALQAAITSTGARPAPSPSTGTPAHRGVPRTAAYLRAAEQAAARSAARRADALAGPPAALLASIAACEATHAELLS